MKRTLLFLLVMVIMAILAIHHSLLPCEEISNKNDSNIKDNGIDIPVDLGAIWNKSNTSVLTEYFLIANTTAVSNGSINLNHEVWVERDGGMGRLYCISVIKTNASMLKYNQTISFDDSISYYGWARRDKPSREEFGIGMIDFSDKIDKPVAINCTVNVQNIVTNETVRQKMRFIVS